MADDHKNSADIDRLNAVALGALCGLSVDWRSELVDLFRSDVPISSAVREELANALEGKSSFGVSLTMQGHERSSRRIDGLNARRIWYADGERVVPYVEKAPNVTEAFYLAAEDLNKDSDYCRKKYYYYTQCERWINDARKDGFFYSRMDNRSLMDVWHLASIEQKKDSPTPLSGGDFDRIRFSRIKFYSEICRDWRNRNLAVDLFVGLSELLPAEN